MPSLATRTLLTKPRSAVAFTVAGNEMADTFGVSRSANTQGDGLTFPNKSVGVWPAATNRNDNGNATTNTTGITDTSSTTTRATSGVTQFGTTAFNVVSSNLATNEGPNQLINGGLASTLYTVSAWVWLVSGAATVRAALYDTVAGKQGGTAVALTATPQRVTVSATTGVAGLNAASYIETAVQQVGTWRIGGWQVETGAVATPYVQTDGADATRAGGRVRIPITPAPFTTTTGFIAMRLRMAATTAAVATRNLDLLAVSWQFDANNYIWLYYHRSAGEWRVVRGDNASATEAAVASTLTINGFTTLVCYWTATTVGMSVNGSAFTTTANSNISTTPVTAIDVGSTGTAKQLLGNVFWAVFGSGTPTGADAAWFNSIGTGGGVPDLYACPGNATFVWDARNAVAVTRAA